MAEQWKSSLIQRTWKHIWIHGFVIGVGVVLTGFLVWFFLTDTLWSSTSPREGTALLVQAPAGAGPPAPAEAAAHLKSQLAPVLAGIKEANQKKDLPQLLSQYSPNFPQLQQRVENIAKTWKIYDYPKMDFAITEARLLADQTAEARVNCEVEAHHTGTHHHKNIVKTYLIRFARESGQWRIKALNQAE